ncbi:hypothetical protein T265_04304 [Opisthorchis viverrini]|uniref:Uncharacterized protein n=1 Tax=Opisthorchis viverrini TaxID=6198 RepID=A0A074ZNP0_OPIVI|nr:hypothetical protein T265_04304 [Opisthorchis viverrini]KER29013.1 hypothetical protein T265_04304 [Opisthorchis viverrini]
MNDPKYIGTIAKINSTEEDKTIPLSGMFSAVAFKVALTTVLAFKGSITATTQSGVQIGRARVDEPSVGRPHSQFNLRSVGLQELPELR